MKIDKDKIDLVCGKIIEYSLYCLVFFLPASKSMIEICATIATLARLVKKKNKFQHTKTPLS